MHKDLDDINNLITQCEKLYEYGLKFGNIKGNEQEYIKFKHLLFKFDKKYVNEFMTSDYGPKFAIKKFIGAEYWTPSGIKTIINLLSQIKEENFSLGKSKVDPMSIWLFMHIDIINVSKQKWLDGHYADAVESAMKEINGRLKVIYLEKNGIEKDGQDLMRNVFKPSSPVLFIEDNSTSNGKNIQEGYMNIFAGAIQSMRNPKSHINVTISKDEAVKQLIIASHLMDKIDEAITFTSSIDDK